MIRFRIYQTKTGIHHVPIEKNKIVFHMDWFINCVRVRFNYDIDGIVHMWNNDIYGEQLINENHSFPFIK